MSQWKTLAARYGSVGEHGAYNVAIGLYYQDLVEQAYENVSSLGTGHGGHGLTWYRLMEAEALTRQAAVRQRLSDWLEIEAIPDELGSVYERLPDILRQETESVAARLEFRPRPPVLVTILAEEADAPWTPNRQGFCVDMVPYEKIVLPRHVAVIETEMREAVRHEYAHVVTLHAALGRCPRWLDEAIAMAMGGEMDGSDGRDFAAGALEWLNPRDLDRAYLEDREDARGREEVWLAYQQSAWIGRYLCQRDGEADLARLLRAFANNSRWTDLRMLFTGQEPADEALREVFGYGVEEVFDRSLDWLEDRFG